ncbi:hypothetical protein [Kribbella solani]|uniref:Uncharacterized protein n=1 Tax=Kribbella solani TaxID=236067 RepID=A0A841DVF3_9ACTN|nr:hypothetical protein [Kribbella solani]MBB5980736.1 hypothetical protein [Kribbella solani]MDX2967589.1 hypothetical protein [Kribbella solani]MDX3002521.1 hypothetical protein [Kribbella solani]
MFFERDDVDRAGPAHFGIHPDAFAAERPDRRPEEAKRMGLSRHTEEGAVLSFASSLDRGKPGHRMIAWVLLVTFAAPAIYTLFALL